MVADPLLRKSCSSTSVQEHVYLHVLVNGYYHHRFFHKLHFLILSSRCAFWCFFICAYNPHRLPHSGHFNFFFWKIKLLRKIWKNLFIFFLLFYSICNFIWIYVNMCAISIQTICRIYLDVIQICRLC